MIIKYSSGVLHLLFYRLSSLNCKIKLKRKDNCSGTLALELQHTRTQQPGTPKAKPKTNDKLKRKLSWMNTKQKPLEETATLEVHPVTRKPSIGVVPDSFDASQLPSSRSSSEERDGPDHSTQKKCEDCGDKCIEKQYGGFLTFLIIDREVFDIYLNLTSLLAKLYPVRKQSAFRCYKSH